jgi:hypothetical protein
MNNALRRFSMILTIVFLLSHLLLMRDAFARKEIPGFSSRAGSDLYSTEKSSKGSFFSSSKSGKSALYTFRSKTKGKKGSVFNFWSKRTTKGTSLVQAAQIADSESKFTTLIEGIQTNKTYRQVVTENKPLSEFLTTTALETRNARRSIFYKSYDPLNAYYKYSPTVVYSDPYNDFFFRYVTLEWMFHHWDNIDKRRLDGVKLQELETKMEQMEQEGSVRDPNYMMPGVDPDLQYSDEELENLQEAKDVIELEAERGVEGGGFGWLVIFLVGFIVVGGVYFVAVRR